MAEKFYGCKTLLEYYIRKIGSSATIMRNSFKPGADVDRIGEITAVQPFYWGSWHIMLTLRVKDEAENSHLTDVYSTDVKIW